MGVGGEEAREKEEDEKRIRKRKGKGKGLGNPSLVSLDVQQQKPAWVERKKITALDAHSEIGSSTIMK